MNGLKGNWIFGLIIIVVGVILLGNNLDIIDINLSNLLFTYWPVFFILGGINAFLNRGSIGEIITGFILFALGGILIGNNLNYIQVDISLLWKLFWPVIIILIGINLVFRPKSSVNGKSNFAIMGGIERKTKGWKLESTSFVALMGGIELDLTVADISEGQTSIELTAILGGIDIIVPKDIQIECSGSAILGGLDMLDKSTGGIFSNASSFQEGNSNQIIKINSTAILGGIEIKQR